MAEVRILREYCKGCALCIGVCPKHCLRMSEEVSEVGVQMAEVVEGPECSGCLQCHTVCPDCAIEIYEAAKGSAAAKTDQKAGGAKSKPAAKTTRQEGR